MKGKKITHILSQKGIRKRALRESFEEWEIYKQSEEHGGELLVFLPKVYLPGTSTEDNLRAFDLQPMVLFKKFPSMKFLQLQREKRISKLFFNCLILIPKKPS